MNDRTESDDYLHIEQNNLQECLVSIPGSDVSTVICEGDRAYIATFNGVLGGAITVAARVHWQAWHVIIAIIIARIAADATAVTLMAVYDTAAVVTLTGCVIEVVIVGIVTIATTLKPAVAQHGAVTVRVAQMLDDAHVKHVVGFFGCRLFAASPFARTFHVSPFG